jgi:trimethylamine--corrinoid protein Co-methyltransferase
MQRRIRYARKLCEGINEALLDYIARRQREIPAEDALNTEF